MTTHGHTDDFDIGKTIFEKLKDLPPERQQRVLRWVSEGLGVSASSPGATPTPPAPSVNSPSAPPLPPGTATDVKTFVADKAPKSDCQFAAVVAYFYRFEATPAERRDTINADCLQEATRLAGRHRLGSPIMTLNNAKSMGYLDSTTRGEFSINSVGENLVAMTLPGGTETNPKQNRAKSAKRGATKLSGKKG